jgi:hypothetical protein
MARPCQGDPSPRYRPAATTRRRRQRVFRRPDQPLDARNTQQRLTPQIEQGSKAALSPVTDENFATLL